MQALVVGSAVVDVALVVDFQGLNQEGQGTGLRLHEVTLPQLLADLQELHCRRVFADQQASQMVSHTADKVLRFKTFANNVVQDEQDVTCVAMQDMVDNLEIIVVIKNIQVVDDILVSDVLSAEAHHLVENGEGVAEGTVGFLGDDVQSFGFGGHALVLGDKSQMTGNVVDRNALEVKYLASR